MTDSGENLWTVVTNKRKKTLEELNFGNIRSITPSPGFEQKITEPCWFYNNGGCKHKDGSEKAAEECKYLHTFSDNVKRPPHLSTKKPCDKFNLEGECRWHDSCKYSHRNLSPEEWSRFYPNVPFTIRSNVQKRIAIETKLQDIEGRMKVIEYKQDGMCRDIQYIGQMLQKWLQYQQRPYPAFGNYMKN